MSVIIDVKWCNCNACWIVFCEFLSMTDPEFLGGFAEKFRVNWKGLPVVAHEEIVK